VTESQATFRIDFEPVGRRIDVPAGTDLLTAAQKAGVDLVAACGGIGICGTCRLRLVDGTLTPPSLTEEDTLTPQELEQGFRLACQSQPLSNVRVDIPPESLPAPQKLQVDGHEVAVEFDPAIQVVDVKLAPPHIADLRSDLRRVDDELAGRGLPPLTASLEVLTQVSHTLRHNDWSARLVLRKGSGDNIAAALPPGSPVLGVACDIGSTKLAVYLVDLVKGVTLASAGAMNPQIAYGEDVVSRIAFANKEDANRRLLQTRLVETINQTIAELCRQNGTQPTQVVDAVMVGNTAMHHFFAGLPVEQLGAAPYVPVVSDPLDLRAQEVGLKLAPGAWVHLPANIAGYMGADHTAALLATHGYIDDHTVVLVDIGTNTEISLIHQGSISSCSTASGPAFEGAHIRDGMRAAPGAIERTRITAEETHVSTVGGLPAVGICGTGILHAIADMLDCGVLDSRGVLNREDRRVRVPERKAEFLLVPAAQSGHGRDVVITRGDVHEIQLAKGAIRAGIEILIREAGLTPADVQLWVIAGAFGTYLDLKSAVRIGMFPDQPLERFRQVGNAAGVGAKQMLLSRQKRLEANRLVEQVAYVELTIYPQFTQEFVKAMYLKSS
jgi:uncharacterized 2Fe-2S/4Fe-4S cluster protein (DUF4445 family)